ncbi:hypothetical protein [Pseudomonas sp. 5P_5.1_Bac1]|uniref:hypothetical protein n=1 Tax=Pseudomonas sp. 5P_5.1_Bac1 TaxID=2971616 RepID=UPI0021C62183|nr:hypothetical protein [Pseudomonas sp. 5P_5.1_Bac1]MCU1720259.1 hypothetical protein [Pseudomonas sp. 5P_5.1_Bac1]
MALSTPQAIVLGKTAGLCLLSLALLVLAGWQARRLSAGRREVETLRQTLSVLRHDALLLAQLAARLNVLTDSCDIALQQQQLKLQCTGTAFARIKAQGRELAGNAQRVGNESRQSLRLAREGQAGLSATLMAFRSMDKSATAAEAEGAMMVRDVRALARESRDQAYSANLALAGISDAASSISQCGTLIARDCEAQGRATDELEGALASIEQLAQTSAWRSRQASAASQELARKAARLETRLKACPRPKGLHA